MKPALPCPACASREAEVFYRAGQTPVHSCLLMRTWAQALAMPTAPVDLAFCHACGFIFNQAWSPAHVAYTPEYEETQHFSGTFNRFARQLAEAWVARFNIREKTVVEIGCGKGEFLALLCELGNNRGIGIDPSTDPARVPLPSRGHIEIINQNFSREHAPLQPEVIVCRHTLEHIHGVREFMRMLRDSLPPGKEVVLLFELPDTTRVLRELAFWDVYYEHTSYFTSGSLRYLFESTGFDILDLHHAYDDQYLILAARPADNPSPPSRRILEREVGEIRRFSAAVPDGIAQWRETLDACARAQSEAVLWGAGSKAVAFCAAVGPLAGISHAIDINPYKRNTFLPGSGLPVNSPESLTSAPVDIAIAMNPIYIPEIKETLNGLHIDASVVGVDRPGDIPHNRRIQD